MRRLVRAGPLVFRDPLLLCGALYLLLWSDASGFLRIGLYAAVLHEMGHILVYLALFRRLPVIEVTMTGFCMRTRGQALTRGQTFRCRRAGDERSAGRCLGGADGAVRYHPGQRLSCGQRPHRGIQSPAHPAAGRGADGALSVAILLKIGYNKET